MAMTFQLKDFDGPLDLLLFLINKEKIDIKDIFVSQITDQYIDSVRNAPDLDMDDATDFLVMAATLLEDYASPVSEEQVWSIYEGNARVKR